MRCSYLTRRAALACLVLVAMVVPTGIADALPSHATRPASESEKCAHPHPCDYRWDGPSGFSDDDLKVERVSVTSFDNVKLNGFILRPDVPDTVQLPVILTATPYMQPGSVPTSFFVGGIRGKEFAKAGYAVAAFSVRGTGDSGGCFGFKSQDEQDDLPVIIDWLATREWSNGRVAMQGLSYPGTTPVIAANQNPPALKTIVIAGTILDEYGFVHTPQGASMMPAAMAVFGPAPGTTLQYSLFPWPGSDIGTTPERVCEEMIDSNTTLPIGELTGQRDADYWTTRRFIDHVPGITAATFVVHGFHDRYGSGHAFQDDWAWESLDSAPKRMLVGQWWHEWPHVGQVLPEFAMDEDVWFGELLGWFDYWLKGWGESAPGLGDVEFQDSTGRWHLADAWPPPALKNTGRGHTDDHGPDAGLVRRHDEVVYLSEGKIRPKAQEEEASFLSVIPPWTGGTDPDLTGVGGPAGDGWRWTSPCPDPTRLVYVSDSAEERTVIAGNAFAWLDVESSAPGGMFELQLYKLGPEFDCNDLSSREPAREDIWPLTEGAIDLRYDKGNYKAHEVTPLEPRHVRVDLANLAEVLERGDRLAVVVSHGFWRGTTPELFPLITLHGGGGPNSSHLVLPIISGGFGGAAPTLDYSPKPFLPGCCEDPR